MNERDKLVELIVWVEDQLFRAYQYTTDQFRIEKTADHLIANGVTVPRWIPVTERLPEEHESIFVKFWLTDLWIPGMYITTSDTVIALILCEDGIKRVNTMRTTDGKWNLKGIYGAKEVTHWMPLPEPPKED